jgi:nucleotide-binding universal stress UspA family protein
MVVVADAGSAEDLLRWSLYQASRRRSRPRVLYAPAFPCPGGGGIVDQATMKQGQRQLAATLNRLGADPRATLEMGDPDGSTPEAIRARVVREHHGFVMVGPLATTTLVTLVFGSDRCGVHAGPEIPVAVVPRSAWSTVLPVSIPSRLTVGFHGSDPAIAALAWAVGEADRRDGVVEAIMAWCEGDSGGVGAPVGIAAVPPSAVGRRARQLVVDALASSGVATDRVTAIARRGLPAASLIKGAGGADLLAISAGQSTVFGYRTLGAITLACLTRSPVPVVIVPSHAAGDRPGTHRCPEPESRPASGPLR